MKKMRILFAILTLIAFKANATIDVVDYSTTLVCEGSQTTFTSTAVVSGGATITNWNWDLDADGQFDDAFGPTVNYTFQNAGVFNVGLQIVTDMDAPQGVYKLITVNAVPTADFAAADVCEGTATQLVNQSTIASGSIISWEWDLDNDGLYDNASGSSISNDFVSAGTYVVGLQVTSDQGCQSTTNKNVTVDPMPTVEFSVANVCLGDETELTGISTVSSGQVVSYEWELNGNGLYDDGSGTSISNQFVSDGNYQIGLRVTSDQGCVNDTLQLVTIAPYPIALFTFDNACQNTPVEFSNLSQNVVGTISYNWTFGQEGTSMDENPSFAFSVAGPAQVQLIGTTSFGCADTLTQTITVQATPTADFAYTEVCIGNTTNFTNTTDPKGSTIESYYWDLGDQNNAAGADPFHDYIQPDSFLVSMVVYTTDGCRDTVQHYVNVWALPEPVITADDDVYFCYGESVNLTVNPAGTQILWSTAETTQTINADTTDTYKVLITDEHGCKGETSLDVTSWLLPVLDLSNDTTVSLGEDVPLWVTGANSYAWSPETYLDNSTTDMPTSFNPSEDITYTVVGTDYHGCESQKTVSIKVLMDYNLKPVNLFTPNGDGTNDRFYVGNIDSYSDCLLKVYNRWGVEVYNSNAYKNDWKGTDLAGDKLPDGTYYYIIECDGRDDRFDGAVTILK